MADAVAVDSYWAATLTDFLRLELLRAGVSFSFESVMSHPDKVRFLRQAQSSGYRTYLYFVATEDPEINISRVRLRVAQGGHDVPEQKIRERYARSLALLYPAVQHSHRAYVFDNSGREPRLLGNTENGETLEVNEASVPAWFDQHLLQFFLRGVAT